MSNQNTVIKLDKPLVSVKWLHQNLQATNLVILDASIPKIGQEDLNSDVETIPNTRFFDIKNRFSDTLAKFPNTLPSAEQFQNEAQKLGINKDSVIVVFDDLGIYSSARAWWLFKVFGHNTIAVLDGGLPEWNTQNFKTEILSNNPISKGNFIAQFNSKLITDFEGIQKFSKNKDALIIDARSEARFKGQQPEPRKGLRSGTIPNSVNLPFTDLLHNTQMKSVEELQTIFTSLPTQNKTLIFSCGSGITACNLALGATLAGYEDLAVYDGSWTEYGTLTN